MFCDDRMFPAQYNIFSYEASGTMRMNIIEIHNIIVKPVATRLADDRWQFSEQLVTITTIIYIHVVQRAAGLTMQGNTSQSYVEEHTHEMK